MLLLIHIGTAALWTTVPLVEAASFPTFSRLIQDIVFQRRTKYLRKFALRRPYSAAKHQDSGYLQHATFSTWLDLLCWLLRAPMVNRRFVRLCTEMLSIPPVESAATPLMLYQNYRNTETLRSLLDKNFRCPSYAEHFASSHKSAALYLYLRLRYRHT